MDKICDIDPPAMERFLHTKLSDYMKSHPDYRFRAYHFDWLTSDSIRVHVADDEELHHLQPYTAFTYKWKNISPENMKILRNKKSNQL